MIDYIFSFTSQSSAETDSVFSTFYNAGSSMWRADCVIPASQSWNPANDSTVTTVSTAFGSTTKSIVHTVSSGWWCVVAVPAQVSALDTHPNRVVCLDRDGANAGQLPATYIKNFNASLFPSVLSLINACRFQPVFAGSHYPALGVST